jgi:hypothetical protein
MAPDRLNNFAGEFCEFPGTQCQIKFLHFSFGKLVAQPQMREVMFGNHQATARFLVKSVDHTRAKGTADAAQI